MDALADYTFEELREGMEAEIQRTISFNDIHIFATLTHDYHPLHTSEAYAKAHGFDTIIAHGLLVSSFSSTLIGMKLPGKNALIVSQNFKYFNPAYPQQTYSIKGIIEKIDKRFSTIEVKILITALESSKLIASGKYLVKLRQA